MIRTIALSIVAALAAVSLGLAFSVYSNYHELRVAHERVAHALAPGVEQIAAPVPDPAAAPETMRAADITSAVVILVDETPVMFIFATKDGDSAGITVEACSASPLCRDVLKRLDATGGGRVYRITTPGHKPDQYT